MAQQKYTIDYTKTPFRIDAYEYGYDDIRLDLFQVELTVISPQSEYPDELIITLGFLEMLDVLENFDKGLVLYIRSVIDGFEGKPKQVLRAFESLEFDENFDMHAFLVLVVSKMRLNYTPPDEDEDDD